MSCKSLLLARSEILGPIVNILTSDGKYSCQKRENFRQQIEMQLPEKPETFCALFFAFLKSTSNFEYFEKKEESHSLSISEIIDCERGGYLNV